MSVGDDGTGDGGSVVAPKTNDGHAGLGYFAYGFEFVMFVCWLYDCSFFVESDSWITSVLVLRGDVIRSIVYIGGIDYE